MQKLQSSEIAAVNGGALPVLILAGIATAAKFGLVRGTFSGIKKKETANPRFK